MNKIKLVIGLIIFCCIVFFCKKCWKRPVPKIINPSMDICRDTHVVERIVVDTLSLEEVIENQIPDREVIIVKEEDVAFEERGRRTKEFIYDTLSIEEASRTETNEGDEIYIITRVPHIVIEEYYCNQIMIKRDENENFFQRNEVYERLIDSLDLGLIEECPCGEEFQIWGKEQGLEIHPEERRGTKGGLVGQRSGSNGLLFKSGLNFVFDVPKNVVTTEEPSIELPPPIITSNNLVKIALIDSGVNGSNAGINKYRWKNVDEFNSLPNSDDDVPYNCYKDDIYGYDFVNDLPITLEMEDKDTDGHGTHLAGIILGAWIAQDVKIDLRIMDLKIFDGDKGNLFDLVCATNYAIENEAEMINASLGFYSSEAPQVLLDIMDKAERNNILFISSAGNDGLNNDNIIDTSGLILHHYPSDLVTPNIVSVGALSRDSIRLWNEIKKGSNYGAKMVDVAMEGEKILSSYLVGMSAELSGTSMATGQVTRIAALLKSQKGNITYVDLKNCIIDFASTGGLQSIPSIKPLISNYGILDTIPSANCN